MRIAVLIVLAALPAGCFKPSYRSGDLECSASGACPPGFHCAMDNRCYAAGIDPDLGLTGADDMGSSLDLAATVTLAPPAPAWTASAGGSAAASAGNQLGVSVGGAMVSGTSTAASGATVTFGYFSSDTY